MEFKRYNLVIVTEETHYRYYDLKESQLAIYEIEEKMGLATVEAAMYDETEVFKELNLIPVKTSNQQEICDFVSYNKIDKIYAREIK